MRISQLVALLLLSLLGMRANGQNQLAFGSRLWPTNRHQPSALTNPTQLLNGADWRLDSIHCEAPAGPSAWGPQMNEYYTYDVQGRLAESNSLVWDVELEKWRPDTRTFSYYAGAGTDVIETITLTWSTDLQTWGADTLRLRNFYTNGQLTTALTDVFDPQTGVWNDDSREELIYDLDGKIIQRSGYLPADDGSGWVIFGELLYAYNGDLPVAETFAITLDGGTTWQTFLQIDHTYQNGQLHETVTQMLDFLMGTLVPSERVVLTYDDRDLNVHTDTYTWDGASWQPSSRCDLFYSESGVLAAPIPCDLVPERELALPNPFSGGLVQLMGEDLAAECQLTVFDMHGAPVFRGTSTNGQWQLPSLPASGIYVLVARELGQVVARREILSVR